MKRDEEARFTTELQRHSQDGEDDITLTELSSFWVVIGIVISVAYSAFQTLSVLRGSRVENLIVTQMSPVAIVFFIVSIGARPRRIDRCTEQSLWLFFGLFVGPLYVVMISKAISGGDIIAVLVHSIIFLVIKAIFRYGLVLRRGIGEMSEEDVQNILVEVLAKGGLKTLSSSLFVQFRALKCTFEEAGDSNGTCTSNTTCAFYICIFLIIFWGIRIINEAVPPDLRKLHKISIQR